jgi:hypothetical protein
MLLHALCCFIGVAIKVVAKTTTDFFACDSDEVVENWVGQLLVVPPCYASQERSDNGSLEFGIFSWKMEASLRNPMFIVRTPHWVVADSGEWLAYMMLVLRIGNERASEREAGEGGGG